MINQTTNTVNKSAFAPFLQNGASYAIAKPITKEQIDGLKKEKDSVQEKESNALGSKIALIALGAGLGVFALMKGLPKSYRSKLTQYLEKLESKITNLKENKKLSNVQIVYLNTLKAIRKITEKIKATYNFGPYKDVLVKNIAEKSKYTKKVHDSITNFFQKISIRTSKKAYSKTLSSFDDMYASLENVKSKLSPEGAQKLEKHLDRIKKVYSSNFSKTERDKHLKEIFEELDNIDWKKEYGFKTVASKQMRNTFVAEERVAPIKNKISAQVKGARKIITNDINDNYKVTKDLVSKVENAIATNDTKSRELLKEINKELDIYKNLAGENEAIQRSALNEKLTKMFDNLKTQIDAHGLGKNKITDVTKHINDAKNIINQSEKGELQQILSILKKELPEAEYRKIKNETYKSIRSLDKSIDLETDKLFDKIRDLKIGSAPTDVLSIFGSLGIIGWGLGKAKNKDERTSVALKYGIPAIGAVATTVLCTVGLVSGGTALVLGLASGAIISKIGTAADNARKKHKENPFTIQNIAKNAIPEILTQQVNLK